MKNSYRLSFTGASFFFYESIELANLYLEYEDWQESVNQLLESPSLMRSKSTVKRESSELVLRLKSLPNTLLEKFVSSSPEDAKIILLYSILKMYPFIAEFCLEVLYEKMLMQDNNLQEYEINAFFRKKEEQYPVLEKKADMTKKKLKQVLIKILADAEILKSTKEKVITKPYVDIFLSKAIAEDGGKIYLKALLMHDLEIAMIGVDI